jgi:hypothetical protein
MSNKLKKTLNTALTSPNSKKSLEIIINAITENFTDEKLIEQAVNNVVNNYEVQMRIFMVAVGKEKFKRIVKLMQMSEDIENCLFEYSKIGELDPKELVAFYGQLGRSLKNEQEFVKIVTDQRLEIMNATQSMKPFVDEVSDDKGNFNIINKLHPAKRDRVRRLVDGIINGNKLSKDED